MKKILALLVLVIVGFSAYYFLWKKKDASPGEGKQAPIAVKTHSDEFNNAVDAMMGEYYGIKTALVEEDVTKAKAAAAKFIERIDSIPVKELNKESALIVATATQNMEDLKANAASIASQNDIKEMRYDFRNISDMLYPGFFMTINYEGAPVYLQHCPMAFDDDQGANWISNSNEIVNPYLGKNHPKFRGTMLNCGEVKDSMSVQ